MSLTTYPRALLATAVFLVMFGATLALAVDVRAGVAAAGLLAILAYVLVELLVVFNPAIWSGERRSRRT